MKTAFHPDTGPADTSQYDNLLHEIKLTAMLMQYNNFKGKQSIKDYSSLLINLHDIKIDNDIAFLSSISEILHICTFKTPIKYHFFQ